MNTRTALFTRSALSIAVLLMVSPPALVAGGTGERIRLAECSSGHGGGAPPAGQPPHDEPLPPDRPHPPLPTPPDPPPNHPEDWFGNIAPDDKKQKKLPQRGWQQNPIEQQRNTYFRTLLEKSKQGQKTLEKTSLEPPNAFKRGVYGPQGNETVDDWLERLVQNIWQTTYDRVLLQRAEERAQRQRSGLGRSMANQAQYDQRRANTGYDPDAEEDKEWAKYYADQAAQAARTEHYQKWLKTAPDEELARYNMNRDGSARTAYGKPERGSGMGPTLDYTKVDAAEAKQKKQQESFQQWKKDRYSKGDEKKPMNWEERAKKRRDDYEQRTGKESYKTRKEREATEREERKLASKQEIEERGQKQRAEKAERKRAYEERKAAREAETRMTAEKRKKRAEEETATGGGGSGGGPADVTWVDDKGNRRKIETDGQGNRRDTTVHKDGRKEVRETQSDGTTVREVTDADGATQKTTTWKDKEGHTFEKTEFHDGGSRLTVTDTDQRQTTVVTTSDGHVYGTRRDGEGNLTNSFTRYNDGSTQGVDERGVKTETWKDRDGGTVTRVTDRGGTVTEKTANPDGSSTVVSFDPLGYQTTTVTGSDGTVVSQRTAATGPKAPGQTYYEQKVGNQTDSIPWRDLPASDKSRYANSERSLKETAEMQTFREQQQLKREAEEQNRASEDAALMARWEKKHEENRAEQEAAGQKYERAMEQVKGNSINEPESNPERHASLQTPQKGSGAPGVSPASNSPSDKQPAQPVRTAPAGTSDPTSSSPSKTGHRPPGLDLMEMDEGKDYEKPAEWMEKWTGRSMRAEDGQVADLGHPGREAGWKGARTTLSNVDDEVYDVGSIVMTEPLNVVTFAYGVPGGRVGSVVKDAFCEMVEAKGNVVSTAVNTVIDQLVDVGLGKATEGAFDTDEPGFDPRKLITATDGAFDPVEGGTQLQNLQKWQVETVTTAAEYLAGVRFNQEKETTVFKRGEILSDSLNHYAVDVTKTTVYDENTGKGVIVIETESQKCQDVVNKGWVISDMQPEGRYGPTTKSTVVIPFQGTGDDAKIGTPRMLDPHEQHQMEALNR